MGHKPGCNSLWPLHQKFKKNLHFSPLISYNFHYTPCYSPDLLSTMENNAETALLIAVKEGVMEMISEILKKRPLAIYDKRKSDSKNIVLIAVENRQADVYEFLLSRKNRMDDVFAEVDKGRNTALHVAATHSSHRPQHMPGELMQMHWEIKWYEVCFSMPWFENVG